MGIFNRWTSRKGKAEKTTPASGTSKAAREQDAKERAFAAVPSSKEKPTAPVAKEITKTTETDQPTEHAKPTKASPTKESTDQAFRTLIRPLVTEKTARWPGQYSFAIHAQATKIDVQNAVQQVYGVRPRRVNIINLPGKAVRYGRTYGRTAARRKAVVTLPTGKTIDVFSR